MNNEELTTDDAMRILHAYCGSVHSLEAKAAKRLLDVLQETQKQFAIVERRWGEEVCENLSIQDAIEDAGFPIDDDGVLTALGRLTATLRTAQHNASYFVAKLAEVDTERLRLEETLRERTAERDGIKAAAAEQLAALELALPILGQHEPCGYYCDEDHGHVDHPVTHEVYRVINEQPIGATLLAEVERLRRSSSWSARWKRAAQRKGKLYRVAMAGLLRLRQAIARALVEIDKEENWREADPAQLLREALSAASSVVADEGRKEGDL